MCVSVEDGRSGGGRGGASSDVGDEGVVEGLRELIRAKKAGGKV